MSAEVKDVHADGIRDAAALGYPKMVTLGIQHTFTMFGATVLVPIITGMNSSVALFMAGVGTIMFHLITKGKVPAFLGSSFAFIAPTIAVASVYGAPGTPEYAAGLAYAQGGIVVAGLLYLILAGLIAVFGVEKILKFFPPVVTGPIIMVIGLKLAPVAIDMAKANWTLAIIALIIVTVVNVFGKGFLKVIPVLCGLIGGYLAALALGAVDFTPLTNVQAGMAAGEIGLFQFPKFMMAKFELGAIMTVAPLALATMVEHVGDVLAIGATCERDYARDPGLFRTLTGDGLATALSAMFGGPANTTYSENTGVLAITRVWDPRVMQIAACFAILLGCTPYLGAFIQTIPTGVIGGISMILFGMIASIGVRTVVENNVDFTLSRNLIISAVILVLGLGGASLPIFGASIEGMALGAIAGIIMNVILPGKHEGKY